MERMVVMILKIRCFCCQSLRFIQIQQRNMALFLITVHMTRRQGQNQVFLQKRWGHILALQTIMWEIVGGGCARRALIVIMQLMCILTAGLPGPALMSTIVTMVCAPL